MFLLLAMKQKTTLLVIGLTLAITAALAVAPIVSEMAFAISPGGAGGTTGGVGGAISPGGAGGTTGGVGGAISSLGSGGGSTGSGGAGGAISPGGVGGNNGVNGGGTSNACSNAGAAEHNPHCNGGQTPGGQITGSFNRGD
jgi:hypothetical protein